MPFSVLEQRRQGKQFDLFDKRINVYLYRTASEALAGRSELLAGLTMANGGSTIAKIVTPATGRKPMIRVKGTWVSQTVIQGLDLSITNFTTDVPLSDYTWCELECGYAGATWAGIKGQVVNSFRESPGPDGVTTFQILIGGLTDWTTKTLTKVFSAGTPLQAVLTEVASALDLTLLYYADPAMMLPFDLSAQGLAKEFIGKLCRVFASRDSAGNSTGLMVRPDGQNLIAFKADLGTGIVYGLQYISAASRNAAGFDIQAPWIPGIRPGDIVEVNPKYFRQEFGAPGTFGSAPVFGNHFRVIQCSFDFDTHSTNMMTLLTVGASRE